MLTDDFHLLAFFYVGAASKPPAGAVLNFVVDVHNMRFGDYLRLFMQ